MWTSQLAQMARAGGTAPLRSSPATWELQDRELFGRYFAVLCTRGLEIFSPTMTEALEQCSPCCRCYTNEGRPPSTTTHFSSPQPLSLQFHRPLNIPALSTIPVRARVKHIAPITRRSRAHSTSTSRTMVNSTLSSSPEKPRLRALEATGAAAGAAAAAVGEVTAVGHVAGNAAGESEAAC